MQMARNRNLTRDQLAVAMACKAQGDRISDCSHLRQFPGDCAARFQNLEI
jgi:hypothetical protein